MTRILAKALDFQDLKNEQLCLLGLQHITWVMKKKRAMEYFREHIVKLIGLNMFDRKHTSLAQIKYKA